MNSSPNDVWVPAEPALPQTITNYYIRIAVSARRRRVCMCQVPSQRPHSQHVEKVGRYSLHMQFLAAIPSIQYRPALVHISHILEGPISPFPIEEIVGRHGIPRGFRGVSI